MPNIHSRIASRTRRPAVILWEEEEETEMSTGGDLFDILPPYVQKLETAHLARLLDLLMTPEYGHLLAVILLLIA